MRKSLLTMLALAIAIAFSPLPELQAATFVSPGSQPGTENLAQVVKAKKKGKKGKRGKRKGKRAKSKGPGKCGTYMYYSKKKRKCVDSRLPK